MKHDMNLCIGLAVLTSWHYILIMKMRSVWGNVLAQRNLGEKMNFRFHTESEIKRSVPLNFKPEKFICPPQGLVSINDSALAGLWLSLNGHARENFRQQVSKDSAVLRLNMTEKYAFCCIAKKSYSPLQI